MYSRLNLDRYWGLLTLAAVIAFLPIFLPNSFYFDVVINVGLASIVCVGLNLLIGFAGQISLGHAGFFALGAYSSAILTESYDWPAISALAAGMILAAIVALALSRPILRLHGHYLAMATLGMGIIISIIMNQEVGLTGGPDGMPVSSLSFFGLEIVSELSWYWVVGISLLLTVWLALNLIESPIGRALRSVSGSEMAAQVVGVDTAQYKMLVFVLSALIAAFAGSLFAHYTGFLTPDEAGFLRSVEFVAMVVLGGMASVFGSLVGAALLTTLPQFLTVFHDYEHIVFGLVLMLTMIFMPKGLVPSLVHLYQRYRK